MKRFILTGIISSTALILIVIFAMNVLIKYTVKKNTAVAEEKYSLNGEDALISFLLDETNSAEERTHIAVWTLGRMRSKKALPVLEGLYRNDPEGITCKNKHNKIVCQYELYKAIKLIKGKDVCVVCFD